MEKHKALLCTLAAVLSSEFPKRRWKALLPLGDSGQQLVLSEPLLSVLLPGLWPGCCEWENLYTAPSL